MENIPIRHSSEIQKEPNLSGSFSIRAVEELLQGKDMVQELHRHDFYYILVLPKGAGTHEIDFTTYTIENYSIFIMRPGQVHQLALKAGSTGYLLQFKTDFLYVHNSASQNHLNKVCQHNFYSLEPEGFKKIDSILAEALKEYATKAKGYQEILKANLSIFLIELLRQRQSITTPASQNNSYAQEKLEAFLSLVETNAIQYKQVAHYADLLHLSSYQLNAITKALLDKKPSEIITDYLILEAKRQLLATSNQVSQIAYHLGYDDVSYFIRFFKKHTGQTPESFRQNSK
ncbi:AraC family transcriptional regulator [Flavobacterium sp.]|uniref:AraC family transcriptional regulator n=1 Tax=Flavobacterium sp. TaxID=239 RepID=UPI002FDB3F60